MEYLWSIGREGNKGEHLSRLPEKSMAFYLANVCGLAVKKTSGEGGERGESGEGGGSH